MLQDPVSEYKATKNNILDAEYQHVTLLSSTSVKTKLILTLHYKDGYVVNKSRVFAKKESKVKITTNLKGNVVGKLNFRL